MEALVDSVTPNDLMGSRVQVTRKSTALSPCILAPQSVQDTGTCSQLPLRTRPREGAAGTLTETPSQTARRPADLALPRPGQGSRAPFVEPIWWTLKDPKDSVKEMHRKGSLRMKGQ
ncbi:hypothetical protein E2C01_039595 [Portunus trituberculatus]|uniref:Uncharacterized protein n=1 Tax=Portunus trituberculatus TaxID=210409 RepID=A0A5B7FL60_PORTR|nr:hypothetical protein [Portunus trituberculatus]